MLIDWTYKNRTTIDREISICRYFCLFNFFQVIYLLLGILLKLLLQFFIICGIIYIYIKFFYTSLDFLYSVQLREVVSRRQAQSTMEREMDTWVKVWHDTLYPELVVR